MPKALSPAPYAPSGVGGTVGVGGGLCPNAVSGAGTGGCVSPSPSPVTVSALSHYSSSTVGLLEELQICSLDSPGASPTPSPTLSHISATASTAGPDDALTTSVASTAPAETVTNVIIPISHCCNNTPLPSYPPWRRICDQNHHNVFSYLRMLPHTNHQLLLTYQVMPMSSVKLSCSLVLYVSLLPSTLNVSVFFVFSHRRTL